MIEIKVEKGLISFVLLLLFLLSLMNINEMANIKDFNLFQTFSFIIFLVMFFFSGHFFIKNSQKIDGERINSEGKRNEIQNI